MDSSDDEDDDICIEDVKPKHPFQFQKEIEEQVEHKDPYKDERYKYYGAKVP